MASRTDKKQSDDRRARGQSLVEFALILPVFILLFAIALDLGRLFYAQITITNAAREGALQAGEDPQSYTGGACDPETNLVVCRVVMESRGSFLTIDPADVSMYCSPSCARSLGNLAVVSAHGRFTFVTPIFEPIFGSTTIPLTATARAQIHTYPLLAAPSADLATLAPPPPTATPEPTPAATPEPTPTLTPEPTPDDGSGGGSASPTPSPTDDGSGGGSTSPSPEPTASPTPTPFPYDCTQADGTPGVIPPNVIGLSVNIGEAEMRAKEFVPNGSAVSKGPSGVIQAQSPDHTVCAARGSTIEYVYTP